MTVPAVPSDGPDLSPSRGRGGSPVFATDAGHGTHSAPAGRLGPDRRNVARTVVVDPGVLSRALQEQVQTRFSSPGPPPRPVSLAPLRLPATVAAWDGNRPLMSSAPVSSLLGDLFGVGRRSLPDSSSRPLFPKSRDPVQRVVPLPRRVSPPLFP